MCNNNISLNSKRHDELRISVGDTVKLYSKKKAIEIGIQLAREYIASEEIINNLVTADILDYLPDGVFGKKFKIIDIGLADEEDSSSFSYIIKYKGYEWAVPPAFVRGKEQEQ